MLSFFGISASANAQIENTKKDTVKMENKTIIFDSGKPEPKVEKEVEYQTIPTVKEKERIVIIEEPKKSVRHTEVGLNMTTLLSRLVPFGNAIPLSGPTSITLKNYKANKGFRFGFGLQASPDSELKNIILRIGREKRKFLKNPKWAFNRSIDFVWAVGSFDTPGFIGLTNDVSAIGAALGYGIEYHFNESIFISTESSVFLGLGSSTDSVINLKILPPIALMLNVNLNRD